MNTIRSLSLCAALAIFTLLSIQVEGQKHLPYINAVDSIDLGIEYADTGAYARASLRYESVPENDTNYALALIEDAMAKESDEQDSAAIMLCRKGLGLESDYTIDFYNTLANVYINGGSYADAITLLKDTVLKKYPNIHTLYFTLGLAQYKMHKYPDAVSSFEKAIDLDMYDASSHYYLGKACLEQGRLIPALLSLQFYLLLQPDKSRSFTVIELIEQMVENKYQYNKFYSADPSEYHDSAFTELDLLLRSRIALNSQYKATTRVNYTFVKPVQLFFEQLKYIPNTGNYWMEKYVPLFTGIQQNKFVEPYLYFILTSVSSNDQNLQKAIVRNKKEVNKFTKWANGVLDAENSKKEMDVDGKKTSVYCDYWDNNMIESIEQQKIKDKRIGECTYYYRHTGAVFSKGKYNENGEREGKWQWFYNSGALKETTNYINGKQEDTDHIWYENGAPKATYIYHTDILNGKANEYNASGVLTASATYIDGKLSGEGTFYYSDGKLRYTDNYILGKLDGEFKEYYATGQAKSTKTMKNGEKNGAYTAWWSNGKVQETGEYKDDEHSGPWKTYYVNGKLEKEGDYLKGEAQGPWVFYYRNGKKEEVEFFNKNGKEDGIDSTFDKDGIVYEIQQYKDGAVQSYTFKDKSGRVIAHTNVSGKSYSVMDYTPEGTKSYEGSYVNNRKDGAWKYYSYYGKLSSIENYRNDSLNGVTIEYYSNGTLKDSLHYTSDTKDGYYVSYYINGQMDIQGWYVDGDKQGDWYYYDLKGNIIKHNFYVNGNLHGRVDFYESTGMLSEQHFYKYGYIDNIYVYDSAGNIAYKYVSDKGNGKYCLRYDNGNISHEFNYVNGLMEGPSKKYYYNGKLSKESNYLLDDIQGTVKANFQNGNTRYVYKYDAGNCQDTALDYYANGKLEEASNYNDDDLDGKDTYYYESGKLDIVCNYDEGYLDGEYKSYYGDTPGGIMWFHDGNIVAYSSTDKDGNPLKRVPLDSGTGEITCYYPNGNKSIYWKYADGALTGERLKYTPEGPVLADENFASGYRNGVQKYYYEDDTTLKEMDTYYYGEEDGVSQYYYKNGNIEHEETHVLGSLEGPTRYYDEEGNLLKTVYYFSGNEVAETSAK